MPINSTHEAYKAFFGQWERIRDVLAGEDAVKSGATKYLPKPTGMSWDEYLAYKDRGEFYDATSRTVEGLIGGMFWRPVEVQKWPEKLSDQLANISASGIDLDVFARMVAQEVLTMGRVGVITDFSDSLARPYLRLYKTESILNWDTPIINGIPTLASVILEEVVMVPDGDRFKKKPQRRIRELGLSEEGYFQRLWVKSKNSEEFQPGEPVFPTIQGKTLDFIPFSFVSHRHLQPTVEKSPILGLVDMNLSHWRIATDLEHAAHYSALPTAWIAADLPDDTAAFQIGSTAAWLLPEGSKAEYLQFDSGGGLEALERRSESKERRMAVLGARLLESQPAQAEKATPVILRHSGEHSLLGGIAHQVSAGLQKSLTWYLNWVGADAPEIKVNRDFTRQPMSAQDLLAVIQALQTGSIGNAVFYHSLKQGEMLPAGMTQEEFEEDARENGIEASILTNADAPGN